MGRRITPIHYRKLVKIFELDGWVKVKQKGSHISFKKPNYVRKVVIPRRKNVPVYVIESNMATANVDRERYFELLDKV